jgi:hypothetical protein
MTHIEQAIRDAVEKGGFMRHQQWTLQLFDAEKNTAWFTAYDDEDVTEDFPVKTAELFLMPAFWKALGKARGWDEERKLRVRYYVPATSHSEWMQEWQVKQHRFIDHLAHGKDAESFFACAK